jgi:hypothetical protein
VAHGPIRGRRKPPSTIDAEDELAALPYLVLASPDLDQMAEMERRARLAYDQGAEDGSREAKGAPMTPEVQEPVIERFPG